VLEFDALSKRFGSKVALDGLSFTVRAGQVFGFVGRNGAGKTTAMRIALGVLSADSGEVRWRGRAVDAAVRRRIGYMPEERGLYPKMRVREQLIYLARLHGCDTVTAGDRADHWLATLEVDERAADRVESLSLGNQQRVQLAAALVHEPDVLVLDEPFSGLDPVGVDVLAAALQQRASAGVPVVFSSHQLELVERLCDAVGIVKDGRMVATGTVAELRSAGRRRRLRVRVDGGTDNGGSGNGAAGDGGGNGNGRQSYGWVRGIPGVTVLPHNSGEVLLELEDSVDDQRVLDAALRAGRVRRFDPVEPSLSDLFREVVAA
jgi:ABC-2 type transport system ATP-binding protein